MGVRAISENISDETDSLVLNPMKRFFEVIYRILKLKRETYMFKLIDSAIECISKFFLYCNTLWIGFLKIFYYFVVINILQVLVAQCLVISKALPKLLLCSFWKVYFKRKSLHRAH